MSNEEYHATEAVSKSRLDRIHKSIKHDQIPRSGPTPALLQGSAFHCSFLERDLFDKEYVVKKKFGLKKAEKEEKLTPTDRKNSPEAAKLAHQLPK